MNVLERLLNTDFSDWDRLIDEYERTNRSLKVPELDRIALHHFNQQVEDLYSRAVYDFGRARRNKDAIERLIENTLKDLYKGGNELARKAAGIQFARSFPAPESYPFPTVDLFELQDRFVGFYYSMDATVKSLTAKADAKITNNSLLNHEEKIISY
jgi:hypothetical protein